MAVTSRIFSRRGYGYLQSTKILYNAIKGNASMVSSNSMEISHESEMSKQKKVIPPRYRFIYPEFLPDPDPKHRNTLREKLERMDMLARRVHLEIPEFYVGSVLAVTYFEPHAPNKVNRFVGICIQREGCGLRSWFQLRNVVDSQGVEVRYEMYDPAIRKIECLRLEKRLDTHLRYLRDAPAEYSTFPFDMESEYLLEGAVVPVNEIKVKMNPYPWLERWERQELKGVAPLKLNEVRIRKAKLHVKPWEKYDLMKIYRSTIPEEDQHEIFSEVHVKLHELEVTRRRQKHKRTFIRPQKTG